jgi:hypothetical protein
VNGDTSPYSLGKARLPATRTALSRPTGIWLNPIINKINVKYYHYKFDLSVNQGSFSSARIFAVWILMKSFCYNSVTHHGAFLQRIKRLRLRRSDLWIRVALVQRVLLPFGF